MATLHVDVQSKTLMRPATLHVLLPVGRMDMEEARAPFPTLYLLNGFYGNYTDWIEGTRVARQAMDAGIAVVMPSGENRFYLDDPVMNEYHGRFIGEELPALCRAMFPLSERREETWIAGLSMGGYGAVRNGLKYADTFGKLAGLSSAFILEQAMTSTEEDQPPFRRSWYERVLGPLDKLPGSDKDVKALALRRKESGNPLPDIYLACGTEDFLLGPNRDFAVFLAAQGIAHTYVEGPGGHEWDFWDRTIGKVIEWLTV